MERSTEGVSQSASWSFAVVLAGLGGLLGAVGAFTTWFSATAARETEIFGTEVVGTSDIAGTGDWTGTVAVAVGAAVGGVAIAALIFTAAGLRRRVGLIALGGGVVILGLVVAAYLRLDQIAVVVLPAGVDGPRVEVVSAAGVGLFLSAAGGAIAAVAGALARRVGPSGSSRPT